MSIIPQYNLDWSTGRVQAKDIPRDIVEQKFKLWDTFVEDVLSSRGVCNEGVIAVMKAEDAWSEIVELFNRVLDLKDELTKEESVMLGELLSDDTIYAYAILRWEGMPIRMRYYQDALLNDTRKRIDVEASNQSGKSYSLCVKAAINFLRGRGKNTTIGLISKSMPQNSMNMRMTTKMLKEAYVPYNAGSNDNMTVRINELEGNITNTLVCAVASTSALGFPFDYLLLDEFEFWENPEGLEYMYDQVLEPRTFHTKGQIIIYSNPNGKNFVSENLHKRKIGDEYQFHVYNVNFLDVPGNTRDEWDLKESYTHPIVFASTMAALRTESEGAALSEQDIKKTFSTELDSLGFRGINPAVDNAWFLDLGFVYDQSVIAGCYLTKNDKDEVVFNFAIKPYPQQHPHTELWGFEPSSEESVPTIVKRFGGDMARFELDLTGKEGNEINANKAGLDCAGIKMSGPWKAKWYDRFITLVKQGRLKVQQVDNWLDTQNKNFAYQARSLRITTKMADGRSRPYPLYHHTTEKDHDDICFVAGTKILTDRGQINIEELNVGDLVYTPNGFKPIIYTRQRDAEVISKLGLKGTPNHPVICKEGNIKLINTQESNHYYMWNEKLSCIMECRITDTLIQKGCTSEIIIGATLNGKRVLNLYIDKFGKITKDPLVKDLSSITKMETLLTTTSVILKNLLRRNICRFTRGMKKGVRKINNILIRLGIRRRSGIVEMRGVSGTRNTQRIPFLLMKQEFVSNAVKNTLQRFERRSSVQTGVGQGSMKEDVRRERVYNIKVADCPVYFANNVLVHNCDAIVGCLSMIDDDMSDGSSYDMAFVENTTGDEKHMSNKVQSFDEFIKGKEIPSFMSKEELRIWYNKRYGLDEV